MPRQNPSDQDRQRLVTAYLNDQDFIRLAEQLGIKAKTAYGIISRYRTNNQIDARVRGGDNNRKVDDEMREAISGIIERNPLVTLQEINNILRNSLPNKPIVCQSTVANTIDGMLYSLKAVVDIPEQRNTHETKVSRRDYATWMAVNGNVRKVYLDECGYNIWTKRSRGRARIGQQAVRRVQQQKGRNLTLIVAVCEEIGLAHYIIQEGGMTREIFVGFLTELSALIGQQNEAFFIFDNTRAHFNVSDHHENHQCKISFNLLFF